MGVIIFFADRRTGMVEVLMQHYHEADVARGSPFLSKLRNNGDPLDRGISKCIL